MYSNFFIYSFAIVGENMAFSQQYLDEYDFAKMWYNEVIYYDYSTNACSAPENSTCGHYTQVFSIKHNFSLEKFPIFSDSLGPILCPRLRHSKMQ